MVEAEVAGAAVKASKVVGAEVAVEVEARRCIKREIKEEAVGVVRKCDIAMAAVKCTEVPSMVTAIDIGAAAFGYTTITTDRAAGGGTDIGIAGTIDLVQTKREQRSLLLSRYRFWSSRSDSPNVLIGSGKDCCAQDDGVYDANCVDDVKIGVKISPSTVDLWP
jgi:hypothetical protein